VPTDNETVLAALWGRATGGEDVAAAPGGVDGDTLPFGPSAPGAEEAMRWFVQCVNDSAMPQLLLLVGGPGSGKSALVSRAVEGFEAMDEPSALARRVYRYVSGEAQVVVINDATIEDDAETVSPLIRELSESVQSNIHVVANVNRGVIVEELAGDQEPTAGLAVLSWLSDTGNMVVKGEWAVTPSKEGSGSIFASAATLFHCDEPAAEVVAVFMDVCSLLEVRPACEVDQDGIRGDAYRVTRFSERSGLPSESIAGGALMDELAGLLAPVPGSGVLDPIEANITSFASPLLREGFQSLLRGAEIVAGARMTYRELWGAIALVLLGNLPSHLGPDELRSWVAHNQPASNDSADNFRSVMRLADQRGWQALFGNDNGSLSDQSGGVDDWSPVLRFTAQVDPILDSHHEWSSPLFDAFIDAGSERTPLQILGAAISERAGDDTVLTAFDWAVDAAYVRAIADAAVGDPMKREFTSWYGRYLTRMLAVVSAKPAFSAEIDDWTFAWKASPGLPDSLADRLRTLLLPSDIEGGNALLLPVFESRTVPVTTSPDSPKVVLKVNQHWSLVSRLMGDQITVRLVADGQDLVELDLDFTMMREALACDNGWKGVTERAVAASPRLERFRATLLRSGSDQTASFYVRDRDGAHRIYIEAVSE
jgi:hypothetical protein